MGFRWLPLVYALISFVQTSSSYADEKPEEILLGDFARRDEVKIREKRQSGCQDINVHCEAWPSSYCKEYELFMKKNCASKCGYCSGPTVCKDKKRYCPTWKTSGYCDSSHKYYNYMKANCAKTCGICGASGGGICSVNGSSDKVRSCEFNQDTCDWHNVPFDDETDFKVRTGGNGAEPDSGAGGTGGFLVTEKSSGRAKLLIPFELVLADHESDYGRMCIRFNYFMKGGTLTLYEIENKKGSPSRVIKTLSGNQGSQWKCEKVSVTVSVQKQLLFEASLSGSPIGLDDISFTDTC